LVFHYQLPCLLFQDKFLVLVFLMQAHHLGTVLLANLHLLLFCLLLDLEHCLSFLGFGFLLDQLALLLLLHFQHILAMLGLLIQAFTVGGLLGFDR